MPSKAGCFFGKHFIVINGASFILKRERDNGKTVPHIINDLINGEWLFFIFLLDEGLKKKGGRQNVCLLFLYCHSQCW